jgi:hypothetical protein
MFLREELFFHQERCERMAEKPFKDREEVKRWIGIWGRVDAFCIIISFLFIMVGVIGDALKIHLLVASTTWLLLGIYFAVIALGPIIHLVAMKNLYGIETENKK